MPVPTLQEDIVPLAAIYGPNAAGKSNLIDALDEIRRAVVKSHKGLDATDPIPRYPFRLDDESRTNPTQFDCTFTVGGSSDDESENVYEYGFEFTAREFEREWLYQTVRKQRQSTQMLFERKTENGQVQVNFGSELRGENRLIEKIYTPKQPVPVGCRTKQPSEAHGHLPVLCQALASDPPRRRHGRGNRRSAPPRLPTH